MNFLEYGIHYHKKRNLYNSLVSFSKVLKENKSGIAKAVSYYRASSVYLNLGLYDIALKKIDASIKVMESEVIPKSKKYDSLHSSFDFYGLSLERTDVLYSKRAQINFVLNNSKEYLIDCDKSNEIYNSKFLGHFNHSCFKLKAIDLIRKNKKMFFHLFVTETLKIKLFERETVNFHTVFETNVMDKRWTYYYTASLLYRTINDFEKAIENIRKAIIEINENTNGYIWCKYFLGKLLYLTNQKTEANNIYEELKRTNKNLKYFEQSLFQKGIILSIDFDNNCGKIITKTIFKDWDLISFQNENIKILKVGDIVNLKLEYVESDNFLIGFTDNIQKINSIEDTKNYKKFHCIINSVSNLKLCLNESDFIVYSFYPTSFYIRFDSISEFLTDEIKNELNDNKFTFVEIEVENINNENKVTSLKRLKEDNQYTKENHPKEEIVNEKPTDTHYQKKPRDYSSIIGRSNNKRECSICQMDEWCGSDGCPLDPQ